MAITNRFIVLSLLEDLIGKSDAADAEDAAIARARAITHFPELSLTMGPKWTEGEVIQYLLATADEDIYTVSMTIAQALPAMLSAFPAAMLHPVIAALAGSAHAAVRTATVAATGRVYFGRLPPSVQEPDAPDLRPGSGHVELCEALLASPWPAHRAAALLLSVQSVWDSAVGASAWQQPVAPSDAAVSGAPLPAASRASDGPSPVGGSLWSGSAAATSEKTMAQRWAAGGGGDGAKTYLATGGRPGKAGPATGGGKRPDTHRASAGMAEQQQKYQHLPVTGAGTWAPFTPQWCTAATAFAGYDRAVAAAVQEATLTHSAALRAHHVVDPTDDAAAERPPPTPVIVTGALDSGHQVTLLRVALSVAAQCCPDAVSPPLPATEAARRWPISVAVGTALPLALRLASHLSRAMGPHAAETVKAVAVCDALLAAAVRVLQADDAAAPTSAAESVLRGLIACAAPGLGTAVPAVGAIARRAIEAAIDAASHADWRIRLLAAKACGGAAAGAVTLYYAVAAARGASTGLIERDLKAAAAVALADVAEIPATYQRSVADLLGRVVRDTLAALCTAPEEDVRCAAAEALPSVARHVIVASRRLDPKWFDAAETVGHLLDRVQQAVNDDTTIVRAAAAGCCAVLCRAAGADVGARPAVQQREAAGAYSLLGVLLRDDAAAVRLAAVSALCDCADTVAVDRAVVERDFFVAARELLASSQWRVRESLAAALPALAIRFVFGGQRAVRPEGASAAAFARAKTDVPPVDRFDTVDGEEDAAASAQGFVAAEGGTAIFARSDAVASKPRSTGADGQTAGGAGGVGGGGGSGGGEERPLPPDFLVETLAPVVVSLLFDGVNDVRVAARLACCHFLVDARRRTELLGQRPKYRCPTVGGKLLPWPDAFARGILWPLVEESPKPHGHYLMRVARIKTCAALGLPFDAFLQRLLVSASTDRVANVRMAAADTLAAALAARVEAKRTHPRLQDGHLPDLAALHTAAHEAELMAVGRRIALTQQQVDHDVLELLRALVEDKAADVRGCAGLALRDCY